MIVDHDPVIEQYPLLTRSSPSLIACRCQLRRQAAATPTFMTSA